MSGEESLTGGIFGEAGRPPAWISEEPLQVKDAFARRPRYTPGYLGTPIDGDLGNYFKPDKWYGLFSTETLFNAIAVAVEKINLRGGNRATAQTIANLAWYFESENYRNTAEKTRKERVVLMRDGVRQPIENPLSQQEYLKQIHRGNESINSLAVLASRLRITFVILRYNWMAKKFQLDVVAPSGGSALAIAYLWRGTRSDDKGSYEYRHLQRLKPTEDQWKNSRFNRLLEGLEREFGPRSKHEEDAIFPVLFAKYVEEANVAIREARVGLPLAVMSEDEKNVAVNKRNDDIRMGVSAADSMLQKRREAAAAVIIAAEERVKKAAPPVVSGGVVSSSGVGTQPEEFQSVISEEGALSDWNERILDAAKSVLLVSGFAKSVANNKELAFAVVEQALENLGAEANAVYSLATVRERDGLASDVAKIAREIAAVPVAAPAVQQGRPQFADLDIPKITAVANAFFTSSFQVLVLHFELANFEPSSPPEWGLVRTVLRQVYGDQAKIIWDSLAAADKKMLVRYLIELADLRVQAKLRYSVAAIPSFTDVGAKRTLETYGAGIADLVDYLIWWFKNAYYGVQLGQTNPGFIIASVLKLKYPAIDANNQPLLNAIKTRFDQISPVWENKRISAAQPVPGTEVVAKQKSTALRTLKRTDHVPLLVPGEHPFSRVPDINPLFYRTQTLHRAAYASVVCYGVKPSFYTEKMRTIGLLDMIGTMIGLNDPRNFVATNIPSRQPGGTPQLFLYSVFPSLLHTKSITLQGSGKALMFGADDKRVLGEKCAEIASACWTLLGDSEKGMIGVALKAIAKFATAFGDQYCEQFAIADTQWHVKKQREGIQKHELTKLDSVRIEKEFNTIVVNMTSVWTAIAAKLRTITELNKKQMYPLIKILYNSAGSGSELDSISQTKTIATLHAYRNNRSIKTDLLRPRTTGKWLEYSQFHSESANYKATLTEKGSAVHYFALLRACMSTEKEKLQLIAMAEPAAHVIAAASKFYRNMLVSVNLLDDNMFDETVEPKFSLERNLGVLGLGEQVDAPLYARNVVGRL